MSTTLKELVASTSVRCVLGVALAVFVGSCDRPTTGTPEPQPSDALHQTGAEAMVAHKHGMNTAAARPSTRRSDVAFAGEPGVYYSTGGDGTTLIKIDPATGTSTTVGNAGFNQTWAGAFGPEGDLWTLVNGFGSAQLARFDVETGAVTTVGTPTGIQAISLEFDNAGTLYTIGYVDGRMHQVNTTTGQLTFIGNTGLPNTMDMAFTADGSTLYVVDGSNRLSIVNPATGVATIIGGITGTIGAVMGLAIAPSGVLYATTYTAPSRLYVLNPATAVATQVGESVLSTNFAHGGDFHLNAVSPPGAPFITGITPADQQLSVAFNAPESDGGSEITNYQYSTDGETWVFMEPAQTASPIVITGLINGTTYQVRIRAINSAGAGASSNTVEGEPFAESTEVVPPGQAATVTVHDENGNETAAIDIPAGTFNVAVTVTVTLTDPAEEGAPCHSYLIGQIGKCLKITAESSPGVEATLNQDVTVGLCLGAPASVDLYKFDEVNGPVTALEEIEFLECAPSEGASRAPRNWLGALAMGATKRVVKLVSPKLLYAADRGFGGKVPAGGGLSTFTWAAPIQVAQAGVVVSPRTGKDAFAVAGKFDVAKTGVVAPWLTETGFIPSTHAVTITFGKSVHTIPAGSFKWSAGLRRWVYAKLVGHGITAMAINAVDGSFTIAGIVHTEGALPQHKQLMVQVGHRVQGTLLHCGADRRCLPQHEHSH